MKSVHQSVLLQELIEALNLKQDSVVVDGTLGGAGHASKIVSHLGTSGMFIGIDQDEGAIARAHKTLSESTCTLHLVHDSFRNLKRILQNLSVTEVDAIALDLGLSSDQLEQSGRGFSFKKDEPLLMTFVETPEEDAVTARDIVNDWEEGNIADVLFGFGEERFSRRIAKAIVETRREKPIERTSELVAIIEEAVPRWYARGRLHPATRTFQALRIAVNDELGALHEVLQQGTEVLRPGGRFAIITFHSIEDRAVKTFFAGAVRDGKGALLYKKPIAPSKEEIAENPRARSAKLRIFEKTQS